MSQSIRTFAGLLGCLLITLTSLSQSAFAFRDDMSNASLRQENRTRTIELQGALTCNTGEINDGRACTLRLKEAKTGASYELSNGNDAMRLYQSGTRNVAIEGHISGSGTLEVARVSAN